MPAVNTASSLAERKGEAEARLQVLRRERGRAKLDSEPFGGTDEIDALQAELDALDQATVVDVSRRRDAAAKAEAERRTELLAVLEAAEAKRLHALERAEAAAREFAAAVDEVERTSVSVAQCFRQMGGRQPLSISSPVPLQRLSARWSAVMAGPSRRPRFGHVELVPTYYAHDENWPAAERLDDLLKSGITRNG
jgi:hypothetical protein